MLKVLAAVMTMLAPGAGLKDAAPPIYLATQSVDGGIRIEVLGASLQTYEAAFRLEVSSASGRSEHRGSARLVPGEQVKLSTVVIAVPPNGTWRAKLRVDPSTGEHYEQSAGSSTS